VPGPLLTIDGPFVLYRSFFALPDSITDGDGHAVNALLGAANLILRIAADCRPRAIVVCFGAEAAAYRTDLYPAYHADRPPVPDALDWQFARAPDLFGAFGWTTADTDDLEADDLLGALAEAEVDAGGRALIMTGDRDMYQCAGERVSVVFLKQKSAGFDEVDPAEVKARYGVVPSLVPDFIALRGDPSDGLPGAPGIGPKTPPSCWTATDRWRRSSPPRTSSARGSPHRCATTPTNCSPSETSRRCVRRRSLSPRTPRPTSTVVRWRPGRWA